MSDDPIEQRLQRMRPVAVPNAVMARLIAARPQAPAAGRKRWLWIPGLAAAACALAVVLFRVGGSPKPAAPQLRAEAARVFLPVAQTNILVRADDLGVFGEESPHPFRLVRCVWVDDETYRAADGKSHARITRPREQIVPISLHTY